MHILRKQSELTTRQWVDEDEQDEVNEDDYANNFGGFEGLGGEGGLSNIDFSKLGAGLGGDAGAAGEEEEVRCPPKPTD